MQKLHRLKSILKHMGSVLLAYSGGVDSTFLLKVCCDVLGPDNVLAVTANSETYPAEELTFSKRMAVQLGARHKIIRTGELSDKNFSANPVNRCYFCKKELFSRLKKIARENKLNFVIDASNASDRKDFRPGDRAKRQLHIRSPLQEIGMSKEDIRILSKKLKLPTWDKPSLACLSSRIPYGVKITRHLLRKIEQAEESIKGMGFLQVRLRHYNGLCRIEVLKEQIPALISKRDAVIENLKRLGYRYITLDLEGYRTGSLNEVIKR